jgi:parallel beta-helix repeat protein
MITMKFQHVFHLGALLALTACGGGGGSDPGSATVAPVAVVVPSTAASAAQPALPADTAASAASADEQLAAAMAAAASAAALPEISASAALALSTRVADTSALVVSGATAPQSLGAAGSAGTGTIYYVDSVAGSDGFSGLTATAQTGNAGPWKTLAKLASTSLLPGDTVRLACGSEWAETLRLAGSGNRSAAITVTSWPAGCSNRPTITGSTAIAASAWVRHQGNVYRAPLAQTPLLVHYAGNGLSPAHHPNRGFDPLQPESLYLRTASNADQVLLNNQPTSSYVPVGSDLKLPAGVSSVAAGTTVRVRTTSWAISERTVSSASASRLTLNAPTSHPVLAGWGYYLLGQLWMLDSAGEWHWDSTAKQLYAWMPDSAAPTSAVLATTLAVGIDLPSQQYITLDNLAVQRVGTGLNLNLGAGIIVRNSRIADTAGPGVTAAASQSITLEANLIERTGGDAITGQDDIGVAAAAMRVIDNTITDSAVQVSGDTVTSLPVNSRAAIRPGGGALVRGNTLSNTAYIGIWPLANSTVSNNVILGACSVLDDCGAIYASGTNNNTLISGNLIQRVRGATAGKASGSAYTQAQGIYLDESASGVRVIGNTVIDADNGIHLHVAPNNTVQDNRLYGNRVSQIWLQENRNVVRSTGDLWGNTVTANQIVPTSATAMGLFLDTQILDTTRFGSFDYNRYFDRIYTTVATERTPASRVDYTLPLWQAATAGGVPRGLDTNASGTSQTRFASVLMNGSNVVPNGNLANGTTGWTSWNQTAPSGIFTREACTAGWCARYSAGASAGILSSPNFSVTAGTWYRLSVDVWAGTEGQALDLVVRRGGGGTNGYENLADRSLKVTAGGTWLRRSVVFKATKSVTAADPVTKDLGARLDLQNVAPGQRVGMANLELVPITPAEALTRSDVLVNTSANSSQQLCPVAATQAALCSLYVRLSDNLPVAWPYSLAGRSAEIIYTRDTRLLDTDGDGIPDSQDLCPNTTAGVGVNSKGCALGQG